MVRERSARPTAYSYAPRHVSKIIAANGWTEVVVPLSIKSITILRYTLLLVDLVLVPPVSADLGSQQLTTAVVQVPACIALRL